jgi:flavin reductase (DIM6/NTAB) family NADH-FMN oxidoreductase RutF
VVNVPPAGMEDAVMVSARSYPPEVDEFLAAGIAPR